MAELVIVAHEELDLPVPRKIDLSYSGRFKGYNANVRYGRSSIEFRLSRQWEDVDPEIVKGVLQHLLCKIHRLPRDTLAIRLYDEFLRQVPRYSEATDVDPYLRGRFDVLNEEYFGGLMDLPNLTWGTDSVRQLGSYHYATDTVRLSTILKADRDMLDYVLYHELLHKKHQFTCGPKRTTHHSRAFREEEARFRIPDADEHLKRFVAKARRKPRTGVIRRWFH